MIIHKGEIGNIYNIASHNEKSNIEVVKKILSLLNKDESLISFVEDRLGHDMGYAIDICKIQNELGWSPMTSFEQGIKKTVEWYLLNNKWWQEIILNSNKFFNRS